MGFCEEAVMKCRRAVSVVLAVLFAVFLAAWAAVMPGEGVGLYVLGIAAFGATCAACMTVAVRLGVLRKKEGGTGQLRGVCAITSRTS